MQLARIDGEPLVVDPEDVGLDGVGAHGIAPRRDLLEPILRRERTEDGERRALSREVVDVYGGTVLLHQATDLARFIDEELVGLVGCDIDGDPVAVLAGTASKAERR